MALRPALEEFNQFRVRRVGQGDAELHELIAADAVCGDALALEAEHRAAVRSARHLQGNGPVYRRHGNGRPEHGLDQGHGDIDMNVFIFPGEEGMRLDLDLEVDLAGFRVFEAELLPGLDSGGNRNVDIASVGEGDAVLAAARRFEEANFDFLCRRVGRRGAGVFTVAAEEFGDDIVESGAEAAARRAGASSGAGPPAHARARKAAAERTAAERMGAAEGVTAGMTEAHLVGAVRADLAAVVARAF